MDPNPMLGIGLLTPMPPSGSAYGAGERSPVIRKSRARKGTLGLGDVASGSFLPFRSRSRAFVAVRIASPTNVQIPSIPTLKDSRTPFPGSIPTVGSQDEEGAELETRSCTRSATLVPGSQVLNRVYYAFQIVEYNQWLNTHALSH
jgi:hypothetical protein